MTVDHNLPTFYQEATIHCEKISDMVQCAAFNCTVNSNRQHPKVSLFSFPKDSKIRSAWVVKVKREGFVPTEHSRLCARHFSPECFQQESQLMQRMGYQPRRLCLKDGAIPTIFNNVRPKEQQVPSATTSATQPEADDTPKRSISRLSAKRRRVEVLKLLFCLLYKCMLTINVLNN